MDFNFQQTIPASIQKQVDQNYKNRQIEVNASKIQVGSTAEQVAMHLYNEVQRYQASLPDDQDVAMMLTQFNESVQVLVKGIGYSGYNLVCFQLNDPPKMAGRSTEFDGTNEDTNAFMIVYAKDGTHIIPARRE